ncbi:MAG: DNA polymerase I [Deltaproteobacteria bacterium]|nr:DNA polymerase I [Deltaproteobacteria bacterium]
MAKRNTDTPVLYLVDGSSYVFRAYHAMPHLSNRRGEATGAVLGFYKMLTKTLRESNPTHVGVAFDTKGPTFRHERYDQYKANREAMPEDLRAQIPRIREVVEALELPILELPGWEADDVLGTLAVQALEEGAEVVLVSGDKDFLQLLPRGLKIWDGMFARWLDEETSLKKLGVKPELAIEAMALIGDASDNVPGVKGIGPKTAGKLLEDFGSLAGIYEHLDEIKSKSQRQKLEEGRAEAELSRELVTIDLAAPVERGWRSLDWSPGRPTEHLRELFTELGFKRELDELERETASLPRAGAPAGGAPAVDRSAYELILEEAQLKALLRELEAAERFAVDTETTSPDPMRAELVGFSFSVREGHGCYLPVAHRYEGAPAQLPREQVLEALRPLLEDPARPKVAQHAKYDALVLRRHGVELRGVVGDPLLFDYLLDPGRPGHGLDTLAREELGHENIPFSEVAGKGKSQKTFDQVELEKALPYAAEDADVTLRVAALLEPRVREAGLWALFETLELPLSSVLMDMEEAGVKVDAARLEAQSGELEGSLLRIEQEIYGHAGHEFSIQSPKQLGVILFEELGLPVVKKTKTGPSTDHSVLEKLADEHPLPRAILDYRQLAKLKSTYLDTLPTLVHPETGRIHTSFSQTTAATGRLASSDPNLQNIPIRSEEGRKIREAFVAEEGMVLVSADYSQIELRVLAHVAQDAGLIDAYLAGQDIHARTASELLGVPLDAVDAEHRRIAKAINFGVLYGMGAFRLSRDLGIPHAEAAAFIERYFERYPNVRTWIERTQAAALADGKVETLLGRRRLLPDLKSPNRVARQAAERMAINTPIQGSAADIIKLAMISVHAGLPARWPEARLILQVHDELLVEAPAGEAEAVGEYLAKTMSGALELKVPLEVEVGIGASWAEAH